MVRFTTVLLFFAPAAKAFTPNLQQRTWSLAAAPEYSDDFDAPILANPKTASELDHEINVEGDECYLGKYGQYDECVDFGECPSFILLISRCTTRITDHNNMCIILCSLSFSTRSYSCRSQ